MLWFSFIEFKSTDVLGFVLIAYVYCDLIGLSSRFFGIVSCELILRELVYRFELGCG